MTSRNLNLVNMGRWFFILGVRSGLRGFLWVILYAIIYLVQLILRRPIYIPSPYGKLWCRNPATTRASAYEVMKVCFFDYGKAGRELMRACRIDTLVDIGANQGGFSIFMARKHNVMSFAIEPLKSNCMNILANTALNSLQDKIIVLPVAVANYDGEAYMNVTSISNAFLASNGHDKTLPKRANYTSVKVRTVDTLMERLVAVRHKMDRMLVKIDAQGSEMAILKGMQKTLSAGVLRALIVEVHTQRNAKVNEVIAFLRRRGFVLVKYFPFLFGQPHLYFCKMNRHL